jgi:Transposase
MSQGRAYPADIRARVLAAILAGVSVSEAARANGVDKRVASRWAKQDATLATARTNARDRFAPDAMGAAIAELIFVHLDTLQKQLEFVAGAGYLREQPAGGVAELLETEADTLIRLLSGLRPMQPPAE